MLTTKKQLCLNDVLDETREVFVVPETSTISEAISIIKKKHISSILVVDGEGSLCGLISEHDVVGAIADNGIQALEDTIDRHMTLDLMVSTPDQPVEDALRLMSDHKIRHLPVVSSSGHLLGFLTILELLSAYQALHAPQKAAKEA